MYSHSQLFRSVLFLSTAVFAAFSSASFAFDYSCLDQHLVQIAEQDRCNSVPVETQLRLQLDASARTGEDALIVWGSKRAIQEQFAEACKSPLFTAQRSFRVLWIEDVDSVEEDLRRDLNLLGKQGYKVIAFVPVAGSAGYQSKSIGFRRDLKELSNALIAAGPFSKLTNNPDAGMRTE